MQVNRRLLLAAIGAAGLAPRMVFAQASYPVRRLTIVVPFDAGGSADRMARAISTFLPMELGDTPVTVVNRPGGSGVLGHSWFIRQPNDGSFALVSPVNPYLISSVLRGQGGLEWEDFHHVNGQWQDYYVVLTNKAQPHQDMPALLNDIRDNPGKVSCAIIPGDGGHLSALILLDAAGIPRENVNWITYDGGGPMRTAIAGDQVTITFISALGSDVISDQVRPLCVYRNEHDGQLWDAPTINAAIAPMEIEVPVIAADLRTFTVHRSMMEEHPETYEMLVAAYRRMLDRDDFRQFVADAKIGGEWMGPEATAASLQESYDIFAEHVDEL